MIKLALLIGTVAAALVAPAAAFGADYVDPTGDNGPDADIGTVAVSVQSDGYVHVKVTVANMPAWFSPGSIALGLDTDRNAETGAAVGADYLVVVRLDDLSGAFMKWDGSDYVFADLQPGEVRYLVGAGTLEFLIRPSAIGGAASFGFWVGASTGAIEEGRVDRAPDTGTWTFEPPPPPPPPVTVEQVDATFVPAQPRAGGTLRPALVRIGLSDGRWVTTSAYRCVATLGGTLLRGSGRGGCTFTLPKSAKGKRLRITLFVTYRGSTDRFDPYVFRVR